MPQIWMSEEVFATMRKVEERVWIVWMLVLVRLFPRNTNASRWYKIRWREGDWLRAPNHVEIQKAIVRHTEPDGSALKEFLNA